MRVSLSELGAPPTSLSGHGPQTDEEIIAAAAADQDTAPILDEAWFATAKASKPNRKVAVSIRLDAEVVDWFKSTSERYQTAINTVLRAYMRHHRTGG